jgi:hypothetical protein
MSPGALIPQAMQIGPIGVIMTYPATINHAHASRMMNRAMTHPCCQGDLPQSDGHGRRISCRPAAAKPHPTFYDTMPHGPPPANWYRSFERLRLSPSWASRLPRALLS